MKNSYGMRYEDIRLENVLFYHTSEVSQRMTGFCVWIFTIVIGLCYEVPEEANTQASPSILSHSLKDTWACVDTSSNSPPFFDGSSSVLLGGLVCSSVWPRGPPSDHPVLRGFLRLPGHISVPSLWLFLQIRKRKAKPGFRLMSD